MTVTIDLPPDLERELAEEAARLGLPLDAFIAACALCGWAPLCTFNARRYRSVPGLVTEQPYQR
jgi:hypothetical protein